MPVVDCKFTIMYLLISYCNHKNPLCPIFEHFSFSSPKSKAWGEMSTKNAPKYFKIPFANKLFTCLFTEKNMFAKSKLNR